MPTPKPSSSSERLHRSVVLSAVVAASLAAGCRAAPAPATPPASASENVWAVVDGRNITREDVEKAYGRIRDAAQPVSDQEALAAKLSLLDDLILQDLLLAKARALKIEVADGDVDKTFAAAKSNLSEEAFQQELTKRGLTAADMREGLRRELLTQKVIDQEVASKITVTSQEVSDFFLANRSQFNVPEEGYRIAQIVVTPVRDAQSANRTRDDATTPEAAAAKVKLLMERLKGGANFRELALDYSEDPESSPRGGDLGLVPMSRLKQAPPQLRDAVLKKAPGTVSVASAGGAHTLVLVVGHEPAGQRDLATPGVSDRITEGLKAGREQLMRAAYLTALKSDAKIVHYLARKLVDSQGRMPAAEATAATKK
ncbi:MAG TPA: SurA N-terminal domain-containing protein [Vicinamibacterales bacterium]|nr:SurA N-terminal domain-containing protein [Vicinamibacterales bacterium]